MKSNSAIKRSSQEAWDLVLKWRNWIIGYTKRRFNCEKKKYRALLEKDFKDCIQEAFLASHIAALRFDEKRNVVFPTYVRYWIDAKVFSKRSIVSRFCGITFRPVKHTKNGSLKDPILKFSFENMTIGFGGLIKKHFDNDIEKITSINSNQEFELIQKQNKKIINDILKNRLEKNRRELIEQIFYKDVPEIQIAKKQNISRQAVNQKKETTLSIFKKHYQESCGNNTL